MKKDRQSAPARRSFLLAVGAGGVAAAAAVLNGGPPHSQTSPPQDKTASQGYRLTDHVRNYYRTAQI